MPKLPTFFIPHGGGPCFFMDWQPQGVWDGMADYLKFFANDVRDEIKAIIVISAHWEEDGDITGMGYNLANIVIFILLQPGLILFFMYLWLREKRKNHN